MFFNIKPLQYSKEIFSMESWAVVRPPHQSVSAVGCLGCKPIPRTAWLASGCSQVQSERSAAVRYFLCHFFVTMLQSWWYSCSANRDWQLFTLVLCSPVPSQCSFSFVLPLITLLTRLDVFPCQSSRQGCDWFGLYFSVHPWDSDLKNVITFKILA